MEIVLMFILLIISLGSVGEARDADQKYLKFIFSLLLVFYLPFVLKAVLSNVQFMGELYIVFYFILPAIGFYIFQLILYKIDLFDR